MSLHRTNKAIAVIVRALRPVAEGVAYGAVIWVLQTLFVGTYGPHPDVATDLALFAGIGYMAGKLS